MSTPDTSGEWAFRVMQMYEQDMASTTNVISQISGIKSRVLSHLHSFVSEVYYEKEFDNLSESISKGTKVKLIPSFLNTAETCLSKSLR